MTSVRDSQPDAKDRSNVRSTLNGDTHDDFKFSLTQLSHWQEPVEYKTDPLSLLNGINKLIHKAFLVLSHSYKKFKDVV